MVEKGFLTSNDLNSLGRPLMNVIDIPTDYMYFVLEKNYVFYRLEKETVKIIRIIDTRQNYINILFGD